MSIKSQNGIAPIIILISLALIVGIFFLIKNYTGKNSNTNIISKSSTVKLTQDFEGAKVSIDDIKQGCPGGQDCIPSIDNPIFESVSSADTWLKPDDIVFGVNHNGVQKAFAQRIMNWHEIVNDEFGGEKIVVTFCPLCGTAVSFIPLSNGKLVEFGVSGKLYNSDLIMYDRTEGNYWQQATGEAIVGPAARRDEYLEMISTTTTTWENWKEKYPDTLSLTRDTGYSRNYDRYPYGTYEENGEIYFGVQNEDSRFHPKEVFYGILVNKVPKAYKLDSIVVGKTTDIVDNVNIEIERDDLGGVIFTNVDTGEEIVPLRGFWFAWVAFNPDTLVYD